MFSRPLWLMCNSVPLDYNNASAGTANIALGRYKATSSARQGIILVNPGGPGMPGSRVRPLLHVQ
jgi:hypothetical protein